jgi:dihydrofolate reductase
MRKLIEATFVSLDGVVGSPEKWALPYWDAENKDYALSRLSDFDAFLLGRVTYEKFAASWSQIKGDAYFDRINSLPKFVPSTTLRETTWNATLIKGDVAEEISNLKKRPGKNIMKYGTGQLDRTLIEHNLIDEFHFSLFPLVVGSGQRLFEGIDTTHLKLKLTGTTKFSNGVVVLTYAPTGAPPAPGPQV